MEFAFYAALASSSSLLHTNEGANEQFEMRYKRSFDAMPLSKPIPKGLAWSSLGPWRKRFAATPLRAEAYDAK